MIIRKVKGGYIFDVDGQEIFTDLEALFNRILIELDGKHTMLTVKIVSLEDAKK